ncbi:thioredoxin [Thiohalobacter thiocyanaticus]|uniref:Thioredoxin n=1 Tax=Thiohalobacter thiocyanaticus TaxID=585455 RepID=A0A426QLR9_9GAMM|nr:thioredoxin [Thiohalobacter thiocyanaticus]RRQ22708.1 thioredoxin [Thiohalobacter thiocyanaticus]
MSDHPNVVDVSYDNFEQVVIENSHRIPVLVDFWAEWCGPCQMQLPVLLQLAEEYAGRFLLAKVDTDAERELAERFQIRSIPTMKLIRNGEVVEEILGAQPESALRALLDRYLPRPSDGVREEALARAEAGQGEEALGMLQIAAADDPDNTRIQLDIARIAMRIGRLEDARKALGSLPLAIQEEEETKQLFALLELSSAAEGAPDTSVLEQQVAADGTDLQARERLAARHAVAGDYEAAMDQYLEILKRDKNYNEGAGRRSLIAIFEILGNQGELVSRYRRQMSNYLL